MPEPLEAAMARYAQGEDHALGEVYDLASPRLYGFLAKLSWDLAWAEDLTHEVFVRVHRSRAQYRRDARVMPWMYGIGRRLFLDRLARGGARGGATRTAPPATSPIESEIDRVLASLPEVQATAYRLLEEHQLVLAEAAAVLGVTVRGVKARAELAYVALQPVLGSSARTANGAERVPS